MFCQDPTIIYLIKRGTQPGPQVVSDAGSIATIILIAVFVAALAFGLLFLLGNRSRTIKPPKRGNPFRNRWLQAIIDIMGEGIEIAFAGMSEGIVFIFDGFINLFKWIFRIDR